MWYSRSRGQRGLGVLEESVAASFLSGEPETYTGPAPSGGAAPPVTRPAVPRQIQLPYGMTQPAGGPAFTAKAVEMYYKPKSVSVEQVALQAKLSVEAEERQRRLTAVQKPVYLREEELMAQTAAANPALVAEAQRRYPLTYKYAALEAWKRDEPFEFVRAKEELQHSARTEAKEALEQATSAMELSRAQGEAFSRIFAPKEQQRQVREQLEEKYARALELDPELASAYEETKQMPREVLIFETKVESSRSSSTPWMMNAPAGTSVRRVRPFEIPNEIKRQENVVAFRRGLMRQYADKRQEMLRDGEVQKATLYEEKFNVSNILYQEALKNLDALRQGPAVMVVPMWSGGAR